MNFEIEKRDLIKGLGLIQSTAGRKATLPILSHVLMEWEKDALFLTATDLETGIREELPIRSDQKGKASVSAKKIYEIAKELPEKTIQIQKKENHWITLKCGKSIFNLAGLDADEFPSLPSYRNEYFTRLPARLLMEMIEKTAFAASNEESRYHLNGVYFLQTKAEGKDELRMVATDGHRLSLIQREGHKIRGIEKGIIIPKKGVLEIKKVMGEVTTEREVGIYFDGTHGFLNVEKSLLIVRLIDGDFPEYEQVIPKGNDKRIKMEREKVYASLKRISTMAPERVEGVKLSMKENSIEFSSYNQDFGDAREEVEVNYEGPPFEVGFNARFLMEALSVIDEDVVVMELKDEGSPGVLKSEISGTSQNYLSVIMPMRI